MASVEGKHRRGMTRRKLLGAAAAGAVVLGAAAWRRYRTPQHDLAKINVQDAYEGAAGGGILLVDIRTPREWRSTGVGAGAVPVDMRRDDFLTALEAAGGSKDRPIALICARGGRSARLAQRLDAAGYSRIMDVAEGMLGSSAGPGWIAAGLPVVPWDG